MADMTDSRSARRKTRLSRSVVRIPALQELPPAAGDSVQLPEPYTGALVQKAFTLAELSTPEALGDVLSTWGVDLKAWGVGNTKDVKKYWNEISGSEAGLEIWKTKTGSCVPIRVTHVLRAKVSSPDAYERDYFLFNTWQQYGDGRRRTRNGLLSEKLCLSEMPLTTHLHDVCQRAVTEEEMQRVVNSSTRIGPGHSAPVYDKDYVCPLRVVKEEFVDHTVEIEASKSYPGLLTVYHLYTVDIVCEGLPPVDFNTLEFDHPGPDGSRELKYIHAWVWMHWTLIQRYLFEGSEMKERKTKGSFESPLELEEWLTKFDIDLDSWGQGPDEGCNKLWRQLEDTQTHLERWGRNDGVPLIMRNVHVLKVKAISTDSCLADKFLFQVWDQTSTGEVREVNRTMAKKLNAVNLPFDQSVFDDAARSVVKEQLTYLADVHVDLSRTGAVYTRESLETSGVRVHKVEFTDHRFDMEESTSFRDLTTMYHLYTVEVTCEDLPTSDFVTFSFDEHDKPTALGWRWVTWQESLDILHKRVRLLERRENACHSKLVQSKEACRKCLETVKAAPSAKTGTIQKEMEDLLGVLDEGDANADDTAARHLRVPPSMVSKLAGQKGVSDDFCDGAQQARHSRMQRLSRWNEQKGNEAKVGEEEELTNVNPGPSPPPEKSWCWVNACGLFCTSGNEQPVEQLV